MKIGIGRTFTYFYSRLFWTLLFILCATFTQTEDVVTKDAPATIQQNLSANYSVPEKTSVPSTAASPSTSTTSGGDDKIVGKTELKSEDVVQSSFVEEPQDGETFAAPSEFGFAEVASQNAGIPNEISDAGQIVVTLVDSASADLQQRAEQSSQVEHETVLTNNVTREDKKETLKENITIEDIPEVQEQPTQETKPLLEVPKIEPKENLTEEIPSFSEWTQKQLEEAEKKREEVNSSSPHHVNGKTGNNNKVRSKNYASPDCGAKIVAANPEAISAGSVLSPSRDEYKLNTCTSRIWFIVELCEAIQAKKIDLANFELFSSSPKDFSVSVSDRFPSREWSNVGQFTAKDERDIQSFDLHPHLFGKYIKVEMHSHHGSEHFCPISLFRVYGTSEFEVLEKEDQQHTEEEDDDDTLDSEKRPGPKNLFSSATDAVISIVKKAAEVLGTKGNSSSDSNLQENTHDEKRYSPLISTCTTPSHIVVCDNCSDVLFGQVFEMLSCRAHQLQTLLSIKLIKRTIYNTSVCVQFGFEFQNKCALNCSTAITSYVEAFFSTPYLAALCNTMAILENKVVLNVSNQMNMTDKEVAIESNISVKLDQPETVVKSEMPTTVKNEETIAAEVPAPPHTVTTVNEVVNADADATKINPTKTLTSEEVIEMTQFTTHDDSVPGEHVNVKPTQTLEENVHKEDHKEVTTEEPITEVSSEPSVDEEAATESNENLDLEHLMSDYDNNNAPANSATPAPPKESVFLRLSNRIKTLERNMSLSSQYLEELSRRYKKQVEEMQRLLEKTITTLDEERKGKDDRIDRLEAKIGQLTQSIEALVAERDNSFNPLHWLVLILVTTIGIFTFCRRHDHKHFASASSLVEIHRRKSIDVVNHHTPAKKQRRPSEEALKISGTYEHLLLDDAELRKRTRERKRKRKKGLQRSNSITTLGEEHQYKAITPEFNPTIPTIPTWLRQESAPAQVPHNWNANLSGLDEAPIVLEESDNNPLQDMPLPKLLQEKDKAAGISSNGRAVLLPVRKISSPAFLKAVETRKPKNGFFELIEKGHKKSASVDETKRQSSPTPSAGNISLNLENSQKKEKKGTLKKIFRKVF